MELPLNKTLILGIVVSLTAVAGGASPLTQAKQMIDQQRFGAARAVLEQACQQPTYRARALVMLTQLCNTQENWQDGVAFGEQAIEHAPDDSEAHLAYTIALRQKMSKVSSFKAAFILRTYKKELARALALDPSNTVAREEEIGFLVYAPRIGGGDPAKAEQRIKALRQLDNARGLRRLADLRAHQSRLAEAEGIYRQLVQEYPDDDWARLEYGRFLQHSGTVEQADEQYTLLLDTPLGLSAMFAMAELRIDNDYELEHAVELLDRYLAEALRPTSGMPSRAAALSKLGRAYELLDQLSQARMSYERALLLESDNEELKERVAALPAE